MFSFFGFFLLFLFVIVAVPLVRILAAAMRLRRKFKQAMGGEARGRDARQHAAERDAQPFHRKVYEKGVGEYVPFEEIAADNRNRPDGNRQTAAGRPEPRISDVEFEDIV